MFILQFIIVVMLEYDIRGLDFFACFLMECFSVLCPALVSKPSLSCPNSVLIEGQSLKLTCDADSFATRVWMKDGKPVVSGDRFSFHDANRVLSINPLDRRDSGEFTCTVSNDLSSESAKCNLQIYC